MLYKITTSKLDETTFKRVPLEYIDDPTYESERKDYTRDMYYFDSDIDHD